MKKEVFSLIALLVLCVSAFGWAMEQGQPELPELPSEIQKKILTETLQEYIYNIEEFYEDIKILDWEKIITLIQGGADPNVKTKEGNTPLYLLTLSFYQVPSLLWTEEAWIKRIPTIAKVLLEHGADPTIKQKYNRTPYEYVKNVYNDAIRTKANEIAKEAHKVMILMEE